MDKDYVLRLHERARAALIDEIGRKGIAFFEGVDTSDFNSDLAHILVSAIASELSGAGLYPNLKRFIDDCVREEVETFVVDDARLLMENLR